MTSPARADAFDGTSAQVVFQPIVDLHLWRIVGFEALARFNDGSPPPEHLDRASACGRREELELDLIALEIAAAEALPPAAFVTLNASGTTILRSELDGLLSAWERSWGIELYEGATSADLNEVRARVSGLGGQLLVDDAGAACADETRITRLRPDIVKIDRSLFWQVAEDAAARDRLEVLLVAARGAGAKVLVEGVADPGHVDLARDLGSDYAQGYHLGIPTPVDGIPALIEQLHRSVGVDAPGL
jgi:EAL domain-containing protein (putative c-di-GMP-specific phosphodiesterase class I)